jgi:hypothetical protein
MPPDEENCSDYGIKNMVLKYEHQESTLSFQQAKQTKFFKKNFDNTDILDNFTNSLN